MFRVTKALNHNALLAVDGDDHREYLILGKGVGFGKKVSERFEADGDLRIYSLNVRGKHESAREMVNSMDPVFLEIAGRVLDEAENAFGKIDRNILFPMADHIAYAVRRIRDGEQIHNPLTGDIQILFYQEFKVAECIRQILKEKCGVEICDDEIGYVSLHVHSAISEEKVSGAMQMAAAVRECVTAIENEMGVKMDVRSFGYNRLMNHIKYMAARLAAGERLKVDMNGYISYSFPKSFEIAETVCRKLAKSLNAQLPDSEIGYLAMHIERIYHEE
ncbi:MAG: PRD domain-containing protein [Clostridiales bacterium]|nr:PRD domain-containing protein [Clostridiales bacterium]MDY3747667.1 PRD domain-containing protein [Lachnospiraceae bacterium]